MRIGRRGNNPKDVADRFESYVWPVGQCWLWLGAAHISGYGQLRVGHMQRAHRLSWKLYNGEIPPGMVVCHHCDVKLCVNPAHLFIGTQADNMRDAQEKGIMRRAALARSRAKLSMEKAAQIRALVASGKSRGYVAKKFGVARSSVSRVCLNKAWL